MSKSTTKPAADTTIDAGTAPTAIPEGMHAVEVINPERRRPVLAINDDGELTVCCRRTARKHGWKIEGMLFTRTRSGKRAAAEATATKLEVNTDGKLAKAKKAPAAKKPAAVLGDAVQANLIAALLGTK